MDLRRVPDSGRANFVIPKPVIPFLTGSTVISLHDSATGDTFAESEVHFTDSSNRSAVVDQLGRQLSINKWGQLSPTLSSTANLHGLILNKTDELVTLLSTLGKQPFLVGGTLLGAVRDGDLLPHDDDADLAYLSEHSNPVDVAAENFALARKLRSLGYRIVHHGGAHMQLHFVDEESQANYYVDIFAAFFTPDGQINQPFHVRGSMERAQLLPFREIKLRGYAFPAPADTDRWLTVNYDRDWRTPIPGYKLRTKRRTQRRFQNWFGSFNFRREFWQNFHSGSELNKTESAQSHWDNSAAWIINHKDLLRGRAVLELGSGSSRLTEGLTGLGRRIVRSDYCAIDVLPDTSRESEYVHLNLLRLDSLEAPRALGFVGAFDIVANHVFEQTSHYARQHALRLIRMACKSGGTAIATLNGLPSSRVSFADPTTWHLEPADFEEECREAGLSVSFHSIGGTKSEAQGRAPYAAVFSLTADSDVKHNLTLRQRTSLRRRALRKRLRDWRDNRDPLRALHRQLGDLEFELDEHRRGMLNLAEAKSIVESRTEPQETITKDVTTTS